MARKKKPYNLKTRITSALRKIWLYSPMRREAVKRAKDNGNKCENPQCGIPQDKLEIDHVVPVANLTGWDENWTSYIDRLFCDSNMLIALCNNCHKSKTEVQRELRKKHNSKKKPLTDKKK